MSITMRPPDSKTDHPRPRRPARDNANRPQNALPAPELRNSEDRYYGLNACLAVFAQRPQELRKVWLLESRIPALKPVLAFCVANKLGYRVVEDEDLARLTGSQHHEGVCFAVSQRAPLTLDAWLAQQPAKGAQQALWLDGVANPHNIGAILRSSAQFGVAGAMLSGDAGLAAGGAAARVAEGGAEAVPLVRVGAREQAMTKLGAAGWQPVVSVVRGGKSLFDTALPPRMLLVMGAEDSGVGSHWLTQSALRVSIPGTGRVESLNVASATAVFLAQWWQQHR
jgi:TrmH RNA methyltransferase